MCSLECNFGIHSYIELINMSHDSINKSPLLAFKTHPEDTVMFAGNELALSCLIKSNVAIRWRKDGNLVSESVSLFIYRFDISAR